MLLRKLKSFFQLILKELKKFISFLFNSKKSFFSDIHLSSNRAGADTYGSFSTTVLVNKEPHNLERAECIASLVSTLSRKPLARTAFFNIEESNGRLNLYSWHPIQLGDEALKIYIFRPKEGSSATTLYIGWVGTIDFHGICADLQLNPGNKEYFEKEHLIKKELLDIIADAKKHNFDIEVVGHSLGGALAQYCFVTLMDLLVETQSAIASRLTVFNSPGINKKTREKSHMLAQQLDKKPSAHYVIKAGDVIQQAGEAHALQDIPASDGSLYVSKLTMRVFRPHVTKLFQHLHLDSHNPQDMNTTHIKIENKGLPTKESSNLNGAAHAEGLKSLAKKHSLILWAGSGSFTAWLKEKLNSRRSHFIDNRHPLKITDLLSADKDYVSIEFIKRPEDDHVNIDDFVFIDCDGNESEKKSYPRFC